MATRLSSIAAGVLLVASVAAWAANSENLIKYRQNVTKSPHGHVAASFLVIGGKVEHHGELRIRADAMVATTPLFRVLFPKTSAAGTTQALPVIREQPDKFAVALERLETAAADFQRSVDDHTDTMASFRAPGATCKHCYENVGENRY